MRFLGERLKKFVRTKFFIIAASVAVFLTVVPIVLASMGRADLIRSAANLIATPFRSAANFCGNAVQGFADYFTEFDRLKEENEKLREELFEAQKKNDEADVAIAENEWLKNFVLFSKEHPEYVLIEARAVARDSGDFITAFTLNKGTLAGIEKGQCVITEKGLVGYIYEAGFNYAKVRTVISEGAAVGAICERSGAYGTLTGSYGETDDGICKMTCTDGAADIKVGDVISTSGVGSVYPYGISLGRVCKIEINEYSRELVVYIETAVDFSSISHVMVLGEGDAKNES